MNLRKIVTLATAGTVAASVSLFGLGSTAYAVDQPVTFQVEAGGTLAIAQTATAGTALNTVTAAAMPVTTVTDGRNGTVRSWTVTGTASDLVSGANTIAAGQITLDESGVFTVGTGTPANPVPVVGTGTLVSATADSIDSVYTYTPTALLAAQGNIPAGSYAGTVTQTVV
jgi:hypothetical protein